MAALTYSRNFSDTRVRGKHPYTLASSVVCYVSALLGIDSSGLVRPWRNNATDRFLGVNETEVTQSASTPTTEVNTQGKVIKGIPIASAASTDAGLAVHCTSDNVHEDCVLDAGATSRAIGRILRVGSATDCDIELFTPAEFNARYDQGTT